MTYFIQQEPESLSCIQIWTLAVSLSTPINLPKSLVYPVVTLYNICKLMGEEENYIKASQLKHLCFSGSHLFFYTGSALPFGYFARIPEVTTGNSHLILAECCSAG